MLYILLFEKNLKRKGEMAKGFSEGKHALVAVLCWDFPSC
jgi:hypothetical protein